MYIHMIYYIIYGHYSTKNWSIKVMTSYAASGIVLGDTRSGILILYTSVYNLSNIGVRYMVVLTLR